MRMSGLPKYFGLVTVMVTVSASAGSSIGASAGAVLQGVVTFRGTIAPPQKIAVSRDALFCGTTATIQPLLVHAASKGVVDAVVSLSEPAAQPSDTQPPDAVIRNRQCAFERRISVMRVGARVEVANDDPVLHNTHIRGNGKTILNVAMVAHGPNVQKQIRKPGMLDVKCDAHKFMQGHVVAFDHPYFALTDETGHFQITVVPPGLRQITVWHETLGTLQKEVRVPAEGTISVAFDYP